MNIFQVEENKINLQRGTYKLDTDLYAGFKRAATNNQMYMALEYLVHMMEIINERLNSLPESQDAEIKDVVVDPPMKAKVSKAKVETEANE